MWTLILTFIGLILGYLIAKQLGDSTEATVAKVLIIVALLLFALWNEGII